ncbi:xyloglucan galactosyltransferase MUR3 [Tanacetum coccineum]
MYLIYFHCEVFEGTVFSVNTQKTVQDNPLSVSKISKTDKSVFTFIKAMRSVENKSDPCIYNIPPRFNEDIGKKCGSRKKWFDLCEFVMNNGLGLMLDNTEGMFSNNGWYATEQFSVDVIFTYRLKQYECLTNELSLASAIFVSFYAGLDATRYNWGYNISVRDAASIELVEWLLLEPILYRSLLPVKDGD